MSFSVKNDEVLYILVSINLYVGKDMNSGHCDYDILDYNTGTWWNFNYNRITNYSGYPDNIYDNLSN